MTGSLLYMKKILKNSIDIKKPIYDTATMYSPINLFVHLVEREYPF